jgi:antitoxin component YwqK of YwqJK toxin-antitoxin module
MGLKEPTKQRVNLADIQWGHYDHDGTSLVMYNNQLFTGYVVYTKYPDGTVKSEIEYKSGSHVGWENEYNQNSILTYSCYSVGQTTQEVYEYDDNGNLLDHYTL